MKRRRSGIVRLAAVDRRVYGPPILRLLLQDVNTGVLWQLETFAPSLSQSLCAGKKRGGRQTFQDIVGCERGVVLGDCGILFEIVWNFHDREERMQFMPALMKSIVDVMAMH